MCVIHVVYLNSIPVLPTGISSGPGRDLAQVVLHTELSEIGRILTFDKWFDESMGVNSGREDHLPIHRRLIG